MAALILGAVGYVFRQSLFPSDHSAEVQIELPVSVPMAVTVVTTGPRTIARRILVSGTLVAREDVLAIAQVAGVPILGVRVDVGDQVAEGQPLAVLDGQRIELLLAQKAADLARSEAAVAQAAAVLAEARTAADEARIVAERAATLREKATISEQALEEKQAAAVTAKSRVEAQNQALSATKAERLRVMTERDELLWQREQLTFRAPVSGVVSERSARIGQTTGADGTPLFHIMRGGEVEMEALVIETALPKIRAGQSVAVTLPGYDRPVEGRVRLVSPAVDPSTRMGKVWISLTEPALRPGSFTSASFETDEREAIVLPHAAVLAGDAGIRVQVVEGGIVTLRLVETGLNTFGGIEITAGLLTGETVIANAGIFLREGSLVTPIKADPPSAAGDF